jgi:hypothetical protein
VFGLELLGCLVARLFQETGRPTFAVTSRSAEAERARALGVSEVICAPAGDQLALLRASLGHRRLETAVAATDDPRTVQNCVVSCHRHGTVILLERVAGDDDLDGVEVLRTIHFRCLRLTGIAHPVSEQAGGGCIADVEALDEPLDVVRRFRPSVARLAPGEPLELGAAPALVQWS